MTALWLQLATAAITTLGAVFAHNASKSAKKTQQQTDRRRDRQPLPEGIADRRQS